MATQRCQIRTVKQPPRRTGPLPAVVERLFAEPVTRENQPPFGSIPQREREHPGKPIERAAHAPRFDRRQRHLGVRMAAPGRGAPLRFEIGADGREVVNLAVVGNHITAGGGFHRLPPGGRDVDDREPPMHESDAARVEPAVTGVGTAVDDRRGHRGKRRPVGFVEPAGCQNARKATHRGRPPTWCRRAASCARSRCGGWSFAPRPAGRSGRAAGGRGRHRAGGRSS